ncbi:MAG: hypothetical protein FJ098_06180, partial [Deltaproteobacteria bacterium]|nr:hypothetical protein [Deltaproteobacteria bacterium]
MRTPRTPSSMVLIAMALILGTCSPPSPGVNVPDAKPDHVGQDVGVDLADAATDLPVPDQGPETDLPPADQKEADACVPSCVGLECGDDGCGGSCGSCWASEQCFFGSCASDGEPGAPCGEDGDCADGGPCLDWQGDLVCAPPCDPADPEPCPGDWECITAKGYEHSFCIPPCEPATCDELGAECGEPEDGCFGVADCGGCGDDAVCTEDFLCACLYETCGEVCCAEGVPCVDGACQSGPPPCDPPCPAEAWCDDGTCVPKKGPGESCGFDVECLAGLACTGGLCCAGSDATCDGVDDDCSGAADEDWVSDSSCGQGYCKANNSPSTCEGGVEVPCEPGEALTPDDATCDSVDDDCDGEADDDYVTDDSCGVGLCKTANIPGACLNGVEFDCLPGQPLGPKDLLCNGVDDDCDGQTDEDYLPSSKCGFGWCQTAAIPSACMNGFEIPCQPGLPLASDDVTCNGVDEDCSGAADEDFIPDTDCGVGWCQESATPSSCVQGIEAPCEPGVPLGDLDSACDGVDEDCDGLLDEDFVPDVSCGLGYCAAAASPSSCEAGVLDPCTPGAPLVLVDDDCDKVDGDCDGEVDEDAATVCIYGGPVTGAEVTFATTIGGASGVSGEDPEGVYGTLILDLTRSGDEGYVTASAYEADSSPGGLAVDAPVPELLDLAASRGAVFKDDPMVRLCAFVADGLGSPMELPVTIFVQAPQFSQAWLASSVGDGLLCTWVTVPPAVFTAGATLSFVATTGVQESPPVEVEAVAAPAALVLPPGRVGLQVPFGPRLPGTTFDVPVRVNTAGAEVGSYKLQVGFDPVMLQVTGLSAGSSGAMGPPVSNAGTTANTTGSLSFNGINVAPGTGKGIGPALELAVIHFKVRPQAAGGTISTVDGVASEVFSTVFVNLVSDPVMLVLGPTGTGSSALVAVDGNTTEAIWTFVPDPVMLDEALITGVHPTTPLVVPALRRDGSVAQVQG